MLWRSARLVTAAVAVAALAACSSSSGSKSQPKTSGSQPSSSPAQAKARAVATYLQFVKHEADELEQTVTPFAAAIKRGDVDGAKRLYASTRYHYEVIEPIAESFGDLDPAIDVREHDTTSPSQFFGFHRLEKALWKDDSVDGIGPVADKLVTAITELRSRLNRLELTPQQIAQGAVELLNEMSNSKITGEEDTYSHTDLSDFAANLAGSKVAFESVRPLLAASDRDLTSMINDRFAAVQHDLDMFKSSNPIGNGYALYDTLDRAQTRDLSQVLDTLAEPMSRIAAQLV